MSGETILMFGLAVFAIGAEIRINALKRRLERLEAKTGMAVAPGESSVL